MALRTLRREACLYAADFCEENIWHLARQSQFESVESHVVVVSNREQSCALWSQRASPSADQPVVWDYHVVLLTVDERPSIYDLDSSLSFPSSLSEYLDKTFQPAESLPERWRSRFRIVARQTYVQSFSSDRKHMKETNGSWRSPPPKWGTIDSEIDRLTLGQLLDFKGHQADRIMDLATLRARFGL